MYTTIDIILAIILGASTSALLCTMYFANRAKQDLYRLKEASLLMDEAGAIVKDQTRIIAEQTELIELLRDRLKEASQ